MTLMRTLCLISLGALIENVRAHGWGADSGTMWGVLFLVSGASWSWQSVSRATRSVISQLRAVLTGRPQALPPTDPQALAAEMAALNAQIAQLRDTATSFDLSFDQTLQRLDERLRRLEQQSAYVQVGRHS